MRERTSVAHEGERWKSRRIKKDLSVSGGCDRHRTDLWCDPDDALQGYCVDAADACHECRDRYRRDDLTMLAVKYYGPADAAEA